MDHGYGIESPGAHHATPRRKPVRYVVVIDAAGSAVARLFLESREPVAEVDASTEEISDMTQGLVPERGAQRPEWDEALAGHTAAERAAADVYTLDV
jgi:hypothetical protein